MRLTASSYVNRAVRQDAREHITRFTEYKTAFRAPIRTCTELKGAATSVLSVWVEVSPQSELMGPSSAGFAPGILLRKAPLPTGAAIDELIEV